MNYDEFVTEEKAIEANHSDFFTAGKKLSDYILIVFNLRTGYKRHEWINEKGLSADVKNDVKEFLARLEESKQQA
ncbi:MAG: hypothetical protein HY840_08360 [Bacteroidetes bacterium]|nr:hypothetical protein [Bacteroidota bacterium]